MFRLTNLEVLGQTETVLAAIWEELGGTPPCPGVPHPNPLHCDGEGTLEVHCDGEGTLEVHCDGEGTLEEHCDGEGTLEVHCDGEGTLEEHCDGEGTLEVHCDGEGTLEVHCDGEGADGLSPEALAPGGRCALLDQPPVTGHCS